MKHLTIVRHAKAEDVAGWAEDFQRPLTERGRRDARHAARAIAALEPAVDWWVTSPAARALETAHLLQRELGADGDEKGGSLQKEESVYMASPEALLGVVRQTPPTLTHVVLVGHNPGLEVLVAGLCSGGSPGLNFRMPTASVAHLELEVAHWEQARWGCGELRLLVTPKVLRK